VSPLLAGLVDDAGLFPPAWLPMDEALARHRASTHPMLSGRFLCPADRVPELLAGLPRDEPPLPLSIVSDLAPELPDDPRVDVVAVELRSAVVDEIHCYVEGIPPAALAGRGVFGKLRCGGIRLPPVDEVAEYVTGCATLGIPFKATQGMHAAVRGWEETKGMPHHGYLNLLLAVTRALAGGDVAAALACTDADALVAETLAVDEELAAASRALFHSYGSCDTVRPVADAERLGLA
jgi:hypothetical protein